MQISEPIDGGPLYAETDLTVFISEPWNALSSLAIALPSIYWALKLKWDYRRYPFLFFLMPLLFLGGIGSMLYHAFRASRLLLWMDVFPTAVVTISVASYFWNKILPRKWQVASVMVPFVYLRFVLHDFVSDQLATNINYFITGFLIFFPAIFFLIRENLKHLKPAILSVIFLSISLLMRRVDYLVIEFLPMGSHFLWHIFSGVGAYYLATFLYLIQTDEIETA